jgi:proteasome lid subunit RPN8/RPN11
MLTAKAISQLTQAIAEDGVREICGLLLSDTENNINFWKVPNVSCQAHSFAMSQTDTSRIYRHAARMGLRIRAIVHSHPDGVMASAYDRREMRRSNLPWIIVHLTKHGLDWRMYGEEPAGSL